MSRKKPNKSNKKINVKSGFKKPKTQDKRYGGKKLKTWRHAIRKINGKNEKVLVKKVKGIEKIKQLTPGYISRNHPHGAWDS